MVCPKKELNLNKLIEKDVIKYKPVFLCYRGSISHGLYRQDDLDDIDLLSVYVAPIEHYLGFPKNKHNKAHDTQYEDVDVVNYELRHFTQLLRGMNPNVMNALHISSDKILIDRSPVRVYRQNSNLFYDTREVYNSYKGYAHGQFERLKKDRQNLDEIQELKDLHQKKEHGEDLTEEEQDLFDKLSDKYWSGWMGKKRKEKVLEYGYDPKWAAHCIRLLRHGREFLKTREIQVDRTNIDRDELLRVKNGTFELDEIKDIIEAEFEKFEEVYDNVDGQEIDEQAVERLFMLNIKNYHALH